MEIFLGLVILFIIGLLTREFLRSRRHNFSRKYRNSEKSAESLPNIEVPESLSELGVAISMAITDLSPSQNKLIGDCLTWMSSTATKYNGHLQVKNNLNTSDILELRVVNHSTLDKEWRVRLVPTFVDELLTKQHIQVNEPVSEITMTLTRSPRENDEYGVGVLEIAISCRIDILKVDEIDESFKSENYFDLDRDDLTPALGSKMLNKIDERVDNLIDELRQQQL